MKSNQNQIQQNIILDHEYFNYGPLTPVPEEEACDVYIIQITIY